ncbi:Ssp2p ASCRUDRAFT_35105, partial [Ascoidea rubescens DSM 1968]
NDRRIVIVKEIPRKTGLITLLSYICGGPLERIVKNMYPINSVELHYMYSKDAESFMKYSQTGLFVVSGRHLKTEWASRDDHNLEDHNYSYHATIPSPLLEQLKFGARRCLILKKEVNHGGSSTSTRHYPSPRSHFSELDIKEIKEDFGRFGSMVEVVPIISKKLGLSINYFDVRSAILAKEAFDNKNSSFRRKYYDWNVWFGKDPTDKSCIPL